MNLDSQLRPAVVLFLFLFQCMVTVAQDFQPGRYYTYKNERIEGLLKLKTEGSGKDSKADNWISFKKDDDSKKEKITIKEAKAFVIGKDSFAIVRNFISGDENFHTADFAQVVKKGRINLYLHFSATQYSVTPGMGGVPYTSNKTVRTYLAGMFTESVINRNNFKREMESLLSDDAELLDKVKKGKYKFKDIESLIEEYNLRWKDKKKL